MNIEKRLFPAQEKDERILLILRRHWFTYAIFWFVTTLLIIPLIIFFSYAINNQDFMTQLVGNVAILTCSIYVLFLFALLINGFIDFYLDVYIITDRRIVDIVQNGLFKREISELNLRMIQDVSAHVDGIFPTLLHYGNINVQTAAETPNFAFKNIPHPYEISKKILDLHEAYTKRSKPDNKTIKSTILEDFGSEECYSKDSCDNLLLKNIDKIKKEQNKTIVTPQVESNQGENIKSKESVIKTTKIISENRVITKQDSKNNKTKKNNIDRIYFTKISDEKQENEEGRLEEGQEVDLK
jgi:hypothetical protein